MSQVDPGFLMEQDSAAAPADLDLLDEGQIIPRGTMGDSEMAGNKAFLAGSIRAMLYRYKQPVDLSDVIKTLHTGFPHDRFSSIP